MIYMLDTDTVSFIVKRDPVVLKKLSEHDNDDICVSAVTCAELFFGLEKKGSIKLFNEVESVIEKMSVINFDKPQSEIYGKIRLELEKSGVPLDNMDMLIAAAALSIDAVLISHNTKHFSRIKGLKAEDWSC
ncbi:MAG: type II toxin-antitoxin system VapC family toxin [Treponema sp.]|nr:type II toxin-antitoxin system VapC family toxin [Treponema sp.]